ncbi:MAG: FAD binding domain-containing protein [Candidatus Electrothrix scaldis]|nr:MAG: FAD binding domain-containing protein [Candidatus Electrothrix sp. GW3-3]
MSVIINQKQQELHCSASYPVLDLLRSDLRLTGTKAACKEGDCGTCLVLLGTLEQDGLSYRAVNSCILPAGDVEGRHLVTIEGLSSQQSQQINPVGTLLVQEGGSQCGFCSPGIVIAMTAYLLTAPAFDKQSALASVSGNLCRCTGYTAIKRAILGMERFFTRDATSPGLPPPGEERLQFLVHTKVLPPYFLDINSRLKKIQSTSPNSGKATPDQVNRVSADKTQIIAGGTDFFVQHREASREENILFLSREKKLRGIRREGTRCLIGAGTTFSELEESPIMQEMIPAITQHFERIASLPIRNRATLGGNIVNASPIADGTIYLLALDAQLHLQHKKTHRRVALKDFFKGYKDLDLQEGELIEQIEFPALKEQTLFNFEKVCQRSHLDIASVNSAISLYAPKGRIEEVHISAGGVAATPLYLRKTVEYLAGKEITEEVIDRAAEIAESEVAPISDSRGSATYKRLLLGQLIKAHFAQFLPAPLGGHV